MKIDVLPKITFLTYGDIPFFDEIRKVFIAYRQCYTKDPTAPMPRPTDKDMEMLRAKLAAYYEMMWDQKIYKPKGYESAVQWADRFLRYEDGWDYVKMCEFIASHKNHESPLEHAHLTVRVSGVSRAFTHQWVRARIATHSQQSTRYVAEDPDQIEVMTPKSIRMNPEALAGYKKYLSHMSDALEYLKQIGVPQEDVRMLYPHSLPSAVVTTMNFRNWMHTIQERTCSRASPEIQQVATWICDYLIAEVPFVFRDLGPKCFALGYCPEHKSCGRTSAARVNLTGRRPLKKSEDDTEDYIYTERPIEYTTVQRVFLDPSLTKN